MKTWRGARFCGLETLGRLRVAGSLREDLTFRGRGLGLRAACAAWVPDVGVWCGSVKWWSRWVLLNPYFPGGAGICSWRGVLQVATGVPRPHRTTAPRYVGT